jgi:hypothetical protein
MDDMGHMKIFVPITKIDAAQRLVYGVVTAEKPDVSGEVCDYASTKPLYQKWSQKFASATEGRSLGNLRAMHGHVAAGKLVEIAFNDEAKQVEICGKVVDDGEWQKVEEGVYTGFSQGGRYLKRWPDPDRPSLMRYTAEPLEVSLVDHPCLPEATFAVIKADGSMELRKFKAGASGEPSAGASLRAKRSNPEESVEESGLLRRSAPRNDGTQDMAKIGARHSKADKGRIKQIHDLLTELDPDCCPHPYPSRQAGEGWEGVPGAHVEADPEFSPQAGEHGDESIGDDEAEKLIKVLERRVERPLAKAIHGVTARLDEMSARVKKIEDQPLPLGASSVRVAEKSEDSHFAAPEAVLDRPGTLEALAELAIRKAQSNPMRAIPGFRARKE